MKFLIPVLAFLVLILSGCQQAQKAAPVVKPYADDAVAGIRQLFGIADDKAATGLLDDAVRATGRSADEISFAAIVWTSRINRVSATIMSRITATPDDATAIRGFVVGSTCEAIKQSQTKILTEADVRGIVDQQRLKSRLPSIIGEAEMIRDVTTEILAAIKQGDLTKSFAGVAQLFICNRLGG